MTGVLGAGGLLDVTGALVSVDDAAVALWALRLPTTPATTEIITKTARHASAYIYFFLL